MQFSPAKLPVFAIVLPDFYFCAKKRRGGVLLFHSVTPSEFEHIFLASTIINYQLEKIYKGNINNNDVLAQYSVNITASLKHG